MLRSMISVPGIRHLISLNRYPVDTLKIDCSFVQSLGCADHDKRPMVDIIVELARIF